MSSNKYALETADGSSPDWVELKNVSDQPIDLTGYGLSDKTDEPDKDVYKRQGCAKSISGFVRLGIQF